MEKKQLLHNLRLQGISDEIINAFQKVRREDFLPDHIKSYAYEDVALPTHDSSTTSQPSAIAFVLSILNPKQGQKILEIGSGSGYVLSLISNIIKNGKIYGIEIIKDLAIKSKNLLKKDSNITILHRSGSLGLPEFAPYDRILVSAAFPDMRIPLILSEQLSDNGILVAPLGQSLVQLKKYNGKITKKEFPGFLFIPFRED